MPEYFVITNSFAAPFFSDTDSKFVEANNPTEALLKVAQEYEHPCGLYAAALYTDANAKEKGEKSLAMWLSNDALAQEEATKNKSGYTVYKKGPGHIEIDGELITVDDPKGGQVILTEVA